MTTLGPPPRSLDPENAAAGDDPAGSWRRVLGRRRVWGGIAAVALLVIGGGGLALFGRDDAPRYADPSEAPLIRADPEPVKERPEQPGGMEVANRDKLVYRRLEGMTEPPSVEKLLPEPEQPLPPPRPVPPPEPDPAAAAPAAVAAAEEGSVPAAAAVSETAPAEPSAEDRPRPADQAALAPTPTVATAAKAFQVQLVAVGKREQAEAMWKTLRGKHADLLGALEPTIARAELAGKGVVYRLRAGPLDGEARARSLC
ncbi:MAG: SPOR domain-containing protein, partial [Rhodospirillales bacterium]